MKPTKPTLSTRLIIMFSSMMCFGVSFLFPAYTVSDQEVQSFECLMLGWLLLPSLHGLVWSSNVFLVISWIVIGVSGKGRIIAGISFALALLFLFLNKAPYGEAGMREVDSYGLGYFLWLISTGIILGGTIVLSRK